MATWQEIEKDAPDLAERVRRRFAAGSNKTIATIRRDGSPRISAVEVSVTPEAVTLGMMPGSRKLADVRRDNRVAIHAPTGTPPQDGSDRPGDAKVTGRLVDAETPADTPDPDADFFDLDVREVSLTYVGEPADHLVIETWTPEHGLQRRTRA